MYQDLRLLIWLESMGLRETFLFSIVDHNKLNMRLFVE